LPPVNLGVRLSMLPPKLSASIIVGIGLLAPFWWTWSISKLIYAFYVSAGSPANPGPAFVHASLLLPSLALGFAAGMLVVSLATKYLIRSWLLFWIAILLSTTLLDLAFNKSATGLIELFHSSGNCSFLIATSLPFIYRYLRARTSSAANAKIIQ
jgi:hypothetical protein